MSTITALLSLFLVVDALFLGLLILLQLPKKEAGIAAAFGAEQTAALFGAGSGTALTDITKWCAGIFLTLCLLISVLTAHTSRSKTRGLSAELGKVGAAASTPTLSAPAATAPAVTSAVQALTPLAAPAPAK